MATDTKKSSKKNSDKIEVIKTPKISKEEYVLEVKTLDEDVLPPEYILDSDIGIDIRANENVSIKPLEQKLVKTGLKVRIPDGHVGLVRDRAGIVRNMNVHTAAGTFDPAYRGEVSIILVNMGDSEVMIEKDMRIAQMLIIPVRKVRIEVVESLSVTQRGEHGFGSTGIKDKIKAFQELEEAIKKEKL